MEERALLFTRGPVPAGDFSIPLGVADVKRSGSDVTIISWGRLVPQALIAAETLAAEGTDVEVLDMRTLVPLDKAAILESVAKTRRVVITHAATQFAGPGAEIAAMISRELFGELAAPVERLAPVYAPIPFAAELENALFPDAARIVDLIRSMA